MKFLTRALLFALLVLPCPARTFTSLKGQPLEATLNRVDKQNAYLTGAKGNKLTVPLASLSAADQKFCEEWRQANPDIRLKVRAEGFTEKGTRNTENKRSTTGTTNDSTTVSSRTRSTKEGYRVTLSNWSSDPGARLSGLTVEYAIVVGWMDTAAQGDKRGVKNVQKGTFTVPELIGTKEISVPTDTVTTGQTAALATRSARTTSGKTASSEAGAVYRESMDGIYLVVKRGDRTVATYTTGKVPPEVKSEMIK